MSDFKKLRVWHESCRFADRVETMSRGLRQPERRWAFEQLVPAAHSIHENLAEGWGFDTDPQRLKYCRQALSTTNESEDELLALERKNLLSGFETLPAEARSLGGMLGSLEKRLEDSITKARNARRIIRRKPAADRDAASGKKPAPEAETDPPSD